MSSSKYRSIKAINNPVKPGLIHIKVNYTKPQIIKRNRVEENLEM
jgi:hypothetical protein